MYMASGVENKSDQHIHNSDRLAVKKFEQSSSRAVPDLKAQTQTQTQTKPLDFTIIEPAHTSVP
jgi:hypothetical protein